MSVVGAHRTLYLNAEPTRVTDQGARRPSYAYKLITRHSDQGLEE